MARLTFPSRLELKRRDGSFSAAPLAKVIFTIFLYVSPVQINPSCDHTGTPLHFHSSTTSGSACLINARSRESILPRQSPSSLILSSISRDGDFSFEGALFILRITSGITGLRQMGITAHVLILAGAATNHNPLFQVLSDPSPHRPPLPGMELPEGVILAFTHHLETALGNPANQILRQGLVVGNLQGTLGSPVPFQFLAKWLQPRRRGHEVEVCLVRGESEQESGLYEEGGSPLDRFLGLRSNALEDR